MANPELVILLKQGGRTWNEWRSRNSALSLDLREAALDRANLEYADLRSTDLRGASLIEANLHSAYLDFADLTGANLTRARCGSASFRSANLRRIDGDNGSFPKAHFELAKLDHASMDGANLDSADLQGASLESVLLHGAVLRSSLIERVTLSRASLSRADITRATFTSCDLRQASLSGATLGETVFADIDFSTTVGLESCHHTGASSLDHRTLLKSSRALPLPFLRGCGLPDSLIDYLPSLMGGPAIQFYSCFISYSVANQEFADRLHADLQNNGVRCWFAPHDRKAGRKIHEQVDDAIRHYDRLLLILSSESMKSAWVAHEISVARTKEASLSRQVLFPISIVSFDAIKSWTLWDADRAKDSAKEIREYHIPDFSGWKDHDLYRKTFAELIRSLKNEDPKPT